MLASDKHVIKQFFVVVATLNAVFENLLLTLNIAKQIAKSAFNAIR